MNDAIADKLMSGCTTIEEVRHDTYESRCWHVLSPFGLDVSKCGKFDPFTYKWVTLVYKFSLTGQMG